jgi:hypothetical protein
VKPTNRSFVLAYLLLVALPLLGLVGLLRIGRTLTAPVSVGGLWRIQLNARNVATLPCAASLAVTDASFTISQSGRSFTLKSASPSMSSTSGSIEGTTIKASIAIVPSMTWETGCDRGYVLTLTATVDSNVSARHLVGVLSVDGCPACVPVGFLAVREDPTQIKGSS